MTKQKNTRFRVNSQTAQFPTLTAMRRRGGLITALLVTSTVMVSPSFAETPGGGISSVDGATLVTLKDGTKISVTALFQREQLDNVNVFQMLATRTDKSLYGEFATRQRDAALAAKEKNIAALDAALAQTVALNAILEELLSGQELHASASEAYKSKAAIVANVLTNPIITGKLTPDSISFLKHVERSLSQGRNPFTTMSAADKAKFKAIPK